jgi:hypothetical protein
LAAAEVALDDDGPVATTREVVYVAEATRFKDDNADGDYVDADLEDPELAHLVSLSKRWHPSPLLPSPLMPVF